MKYKFWDVSRDRKKKPITLSDRILELVAAAMAVVMLVLTGVLYSKAPDTVPSHFNFAMEADSWSGKGIYWLLAVLMLVGMGICASAVYSLAMMTIHSNIISFGLAMVVAATVYAVLILSMRIMSEDEITELPSGAKLSSGMSIVLNL